jgi:hypothetical protein
MAATMSTHAQVVEESVAWLNENFRKAITGAFSDTAFDLKHIYGIAWAESSELWPNLIGNYNASDILSFCVLDGSGDVLNTSRSAFPQNAAAFRRKYDDNFTNLLIEEGSKARKARGLNPAAILYKGYGMFQYDLQFVKDDRAFFEDRLWYKFPECLLRLKKELIKTFTEYKDVRQAIRAYNGAGSAATEYVNKVFQFIHDMETLNLP